MGDRHIDIYISVLHIPIPTDRGTPIKKNYLLCIVSWPDALHRYCFLLFAFCVLTASYYVRSSTRNRAGAVGLPVPIKCQSLKDMASFAHLWHGCSNCAHDKTLNQSHMPWPTDYLNGFILYLRRIPTIDTHHQRNYCVLSSIPGL